MALDDHIEEILELVKASIVAGIGAKLIAINTEKGDGITLTAPLSRSYSINELDAIPEFPFINIVPDSTATEIPGGTWSEDSHSIIIKVHNVTKRGSIDECAKRTYRFSRAISEVIIDDRTLSDNVIGWYRTSINYTPMMTDGHGFKQEVWIQCEVKNHVEG